MHPFNHGQEYLREFLLHFIGSKQMMSGVLWGKKEPGCLIVTSGGRHGKKAGYVDQALPDGGWCYFGQGSIGDHSTTNPANARLIAGIQSVLLFTTREPTTAEVRTRGNHRKMFSFQGEYNVCKHETFIPNEGARKGDRLLRFFLVPVRNELAPVLVPYDNKVTDLPELRKNLMSKVVLAPSPLNISIAQYRVRSEAVRNYGLLRAQGVCEGCHAPAPFVDDHGVGFLEVHHIHRLADDGIDEPKNIAALCPNCHRRAHYSVDRMVFRKLLAEAVISIEDLLNTSATQAIPKNN